MHHHTYHDMIIESRRPQFIFNNVIPDVDSDDGDSDSNENEIETIFRWELVNG